MGLVLGEYVDLRFNLIEEIKNFFLSFFFLIIFFGPKGRGKGRFKLVISAWGMVSKQF